MNEPRFYNCPRCRDTGWVRDEYASMHLVMSYVEKQCPDCMERRRQASGADSVPGGNANHLADQVSPNPPSSLEQ